MFSKLSSLLLDKLHDFHFNHCHDFELQKGIALISKSVENARHSEFTNSDESAQGSFYKLFREIFDSFLMKGKCSVVIGEFALYFSSGYVHRFIT